MNMGHELVPAQIQGADDDRHRLKGRRGRSISLILLLFTWRMLSLNKQVLGAKQPHSFSAIALDGFSVTGMLDVGRETNAMAVKRDGRLQQQLAQFFIQSQL